MEDVIRKTIKHHCPSDNHTESKRVYIRHFQPTMASATQTVYREVAPGVMTFSVPFSRFGVVPIGGRSTAIRMRDGQSVWMIASSPLDQLTKDKLKELGKVRYLVAPDAVHHVFLKQYSEEYPEAKVRWPAF